MAVVIRMKRTGRRNRPCYRISVADKRAPRDGRTLEALGLYDPIATVPEARTTLDVERARHWLGHGAVPSETVRSIFRRMGVYEGDFAVQKKKRDRSGRKKATKTHERREASAAERAEAKSARRKERVGARRASARASAETAAG